MVVVLACAGAETRRVGGFVLVDVGYAMRSVTERVPLQMS